jgi:hypothetical protein
VRIAVASLLAYNELSCAGSSIIFSQEVGLPCWALIPLTHDSLCATGFRISCARDVDLDVLIISVSSRTPVEFGFAFLVALGDRILSSGHDKLCQSVGRVGCK